MTEYNTEKYRIIKCTHCKLEIYTNVYPIPNCSICGHEQVVKVKSVVENK